MGREPGFMSYHTGRHPSQNKLAKPKLYYGCKCVFEHKKRSVPGRGAHFYEESVILIEAPDARSAREKAIKAARKYARQGVMFCGLVCAYPIMETQLGDGVEAFVSFRTSNLPPRNYVSRFYFSRSCYSAGLPEE